MKKHIFKLRIYGYLFLILCTFAQNLISTDWISTTDQDWDTASNWDPAIVPNGFSDVANIDAGVLPVIGYAANLTVALSALGLNQASSKVILGNGKSKGTLNVYGSINANGDSSTDGGIKVANGTLNFQNGFSGNSGTGLGRCVFYSNIRSPYNVINFLPGSSAGTNMVVMDDFSSGFVPMGALNIKEDITLQAVSLSSPSMSIAIDAGKTLTIDDLGNFTVGNIIGGTITGGGSFAKDGGFGLSLQGSNSYAGGTTIKNGMLTLSSLSGLGSGAVEVENGGQLNLQSFYSPVPFSNSLTLNGAGTTGMGALFATFSAECTGPITLGSNATIGSFMGTLTLSNISSAAQHDLTISGDGNTTINGTVALSGGTLNKQGSGKLTVSGLINIEINPTEASKIVVAGTNSVQIGGCTINVVQHAGSYPTTGRYMIVQGPYEGEFNPVVTGGTMPFSISYEPNAVYLNFGA